MPKYDNFMDIATILDDYSKDIYNNMELASSEIAKKGVSTLKQTSPKRTGKYRRGWRVKITSNLYSFSSTIYNSTNWRLTHLLEKPHAKRNGGVTTPKIHIRPVEQDCINEYEKAVVNIIKKET